MSDPRLDGPGDLSALPVVGRRSSVVPMAIAGGVLAIAAVALFMSMSARRAELASDRISVTPAAQTVVAPPPQALPASVPTTPQPAGPPVPGPQFTTSNMAPPGQPMPPPMITPGSLTMANTRALEAARRGAPTLVVDLAPAEPVVTAAAAPAAGAALPAANAGQDLSGEEKFAARLSTTGPERATARVMRNLDRVIPQGAMIPAVLETAINSDLPGYARAVVASDIRSFDGTAVLIPRGSRMIGQYKAGAALGASRVFVIWTRIIRPDGVSIQIASPATDPLGRGGLEGKVDRHFFTRFGGAILLSVLNAGMTAASDGAPNAQIIIGSTAEASNAAAQAFQKDGTTGPTVKTPQGAPVRVFVAQDLDFTAAGPYVK